MFVKAAIFAAAVSTVVAQTPSDSTPCDYYTTALLKENTAANQKTLLTLVVNTAVIGNYTKDPAPKNAVPGILAAGEFNGTAVDLAPYFNGGLASTNQGGMAGVSVNFLDGGGAAPLMNNTAATDMNSKQYMLLTHLYEYFGGLLGCSMLGMEGFDAYDGDSSMYNVHKFMDLSAAEFGYFVQQVALSAASFGVAEQDIAAVGKALYGAFGMNMSPPAAVVTKDEQLQAICIGEGCPVAAMAASSGYESASMPATASPSLVPAMSSATGTATAPATEETSSGAMSSGAMTSATGTSKPSMTASGTGAPTNTGAAAAMGMNAAAVLAGVAAFIL